MRRLIVTVIGAALAGGCSAPAASQTAGGGEGATHPPLAAPAPIAPEEYRARRAALAARMEDGVLVDFGAAQPPEDYLPFAQSVAIRYLTGVAEPDVALLVSKTGGEVR